MIRLLKHFYNKSETKIRQRAQYSYKDTQHSIKIPKTVRLRYFNCQNSSNYGFHKLEISLFLDRACNYKFSRVPPAHSILCINKILLIKLTKYKIFQNIIISAQTNLHYNSLLQNVTQYHIKL